MKSSQTQHSMIATCGLTVCKTSCIDCTGLLTVLLTPCVSITPVLIRIMMQVYWLLTAIAQDQPKNKAVGELRDNCERAALEGSWVSVMTFQAQPAHASRVLPLLCLCNTCSACSQVLHCMVMLEYQTCRTWTWSYTHQSAIHFIDISCMHDVCC